MAKSSSESFLFEGFDHEKFHHAMDGRAGWKDCIGTNCKRDG